MATYIAPNLDARKSLCFMQLTDSTVIHDSDKDFDQELGKWYPKSESRLLEGLVRLKDTLKSCTTDDFWAMVTEGMAELLGAQMSFVSKRILVDEHDSAIEMPPIGETGSCLMASAFHFTTAKGDKSTLKAFKYHAYGCPCGYMRHDKIFVVPERMNEKIRDNPNNLPFVDDSYIGLPLFAEGKCFAHFGLVWSKDGAAARKYSWAIIELFLHSLEDQILQKLLEGSNFVKSDPTPAERNRIIPYEAVTAAQSLKPYARSLSHELRTPMQGVVGMLDVMYATVQEAAEGQRDRNVRAVFEQLKENIEIVQDSSRRAVEAADNVVHAYDMDMSVPDGPSDLTQDDPDEPASAVHERPEILVAGSNLPIMRPNKRRRDERADQADSPSKVQKTLSSWAAKADPSEDLKHGFHEAEREALLERRRSSGSVASVATFASRDAAGTPMPPERSIAPGLRHTNLRNVIQYVVAEGLKVGGRPDSAIACETDTGEMIEVRTKNGSGEPKTKMIEWSVDPGVPETMFIDEKDLGKLVSCVFLNANKFTEEGRIYISANMGSKSRFVVIRVKDTGPGIPAAFLPKLFKPFSREDVSLTRQSEGLGLGLMVAKGIARKLGGDLLCIHADTSELNHGSEFEMRVPVNAGESISRASSPFHTPAPHNIRNSSSVEATETATPIQLPNSSRRRTSTDASTRRPHASSDSPPLLTSAPTSTESISPMKTSPGPATLVPNTRQHFTIPFPPITPATKNRLAEATKRRPSMRKGSATAEAIDRNLAAKYPLTFLVAEDNKINRKLLVSMLSKFGYKTIHEAYDGAEAVRQMQLHGHGGTGQGNGIDVVLMDLWMPFMDGYEATEKILSMPRNGNGRSGPTVLAVTADVTDGALERAAKVGMKGFMTKPFKLLDLQRLILEYCARSAHEEGNSPLQQ